jgi:hypothetical protein
MIYKLFCISSVNLDLSTALINFDEFSQNRILTMAGFHQHLLVPTAGTKLEAGGKGKRTKQLLSININLPAGSWRHTNEKTRTSSPFLGPPSDNDIK